MNRFQIRDWETGDIVDRNLSYESGLLWLDHTNGHRYIMEPMKEDPPVSMSTEVKALHDLLGELPDPPKPKPPARSSMESLCDFYCKAERRSK